MVTREEARLAAAKTYNAAADSYDHPANAFWSRFGRRTVERLGLEAGESVLDVCCGSGASALPAAERVGAGGRVLGVDLAEHMLELARRKAAEQGLGNVEFRVGDLLELGPQKERFDAVICVFGIFFVPDMPAAARALWKQVKPGGRLAISTWGRDLFEPANSVFWNAVRDVRLELHKGFNPWDRLCEPRALEAMLAEAGIDGVEIEGESGLHPIARPEDWWALAMGSGYRGTIEQLSREELEHVRATTMAFVERAAVTEVVTDVLFAVATKDR
jgi:ubiquinone/menaquinone biosynthesis C-methylase UbiE